MENTNNINSNKRKIILSTMVALSVFLGISFFVWTVYPNLQVVKFHKIFKKALSEGRPALITENKFLFEPFTYVQPKLRYLFTALLTKSYVGNEMKTQVALLPFAINKLEESLGKTEPYLNTYLFLGRAYEVMGIYTDDKKVREEDWQKAEEYYKKALALVPDQQSAITSYATNLFNRGKSDEAIKLLEEAILTNENVFVLHYYLGQFIYFNNNKNILEGLEKIEIALDHSVNPNPEQTIKTYQKMLAEMAKGNMVDASLVVLTRLRKIDSRQAELYTNIIDYIVSNGEIPPLDFN